MVEVDRILITTGMFCARAKPASNPGNTFIDFLSVLFYTVCNIRDRIQGCMVEMKPFLSYIYCSSHYIITELQS